VGVTKAASWGGWVWQGYVRLHRGTTGKGCVGLVSEGLGASYTGGVMAAAVVQCLPAHMSCILQDTVCVVVLCTSSGCTCAPVSLAC
jgi:hypothetical protein